MAFAKNTRTGKTTSVPDHYIGHPVLGKDLVIIGEVTSAPKKESKKKAKDYFTFEPTQEQPAPEINIENEEIEDGN